MPRILAAFLALGFLLTAAPARADDHPLRVVATFSILGDMVARIGGERVQVTTLVGPNGDAHVFEPSPSDARAVATADLVVVNGLGMEGWIERLIRSSGYKGPVVVASTGIAPIAAKEEDGEAGHDHDHDHDHGAVDPHAWQDLANGRRYVANIANAMEAAAPADAAIFAANATAYEAELAALDAWVRGEIATVPKERRKVITSHDAFGYFGAAYGVEFIAPSGLSTEAEPSAAALAGVVRQMRAEGITTLFVENVTDPRMIELLAREGGATVGGALYSDALSPPGEGAATYVEMFRQNVTRLVAGMKGTS
jgi:zinc/manganese transport system substrate-binding protein